MSVIRWPEVFSENGRLLESDAAFAKGQASIEISTQCPQTIHISLFFDGTNNNDEWDSKTKNPTHSNVARLKGICIESSAKGSFKIYMPGVGTPFPEIGEMEFSSFGKAFAFGFGMRVAWAYTQTINALHEALAGCKILDDKSAAELCSKMDCEVIYSDAAKPLAAMADIYPERIGKAGLSAAATGVAATAAVCSVTASHKLAVLNRTLNALQSKNQCNGGMRNRSINNVIFNVFGFSRGAASARVFVNLLINQWARDGMLADNIPYQVNFLGLFDTVASVGAPDSIRASLNYSEFDGHWLWTKDGALNVPSSVRRCVHFISIHEQRMSFPLDSIRMKNLYDGHYPSRQEVVYPGVHSDVGGGYSVGEQGKSLNGQGSKLSQIPLHDMYIEALRAGVPLMTRRQIEENSSQELDFAVNKDAINAFNNWLAEVKNKPLKSVEQALQIGMAQSLAWHSLRSDPSVRGRGQYLIHQKFYKEAPEDRLTPHGYELLVGEKNRLLTERKQVLAAKAAFEGKSRASTEAFDRRIAEFDPLLLAVNEQINTATTNSARPGEKVTDFATNDKTDLLEGLEEFQLLQSYLRPGHEERTRRGVSWQRLKKAMPGWGEDYHLTVFRRGPDNRIRVGSDRVWMARDENNPHANKNLLEKAKNMLGELEIKSAQLYATFSKYRFYFDFILEPRDDMLEFLIEHTSDEAVSALPKSVIELMDNYVHDSRAWFRVPYFHEYAPGGYGWPREIFEGNDDRVSRLGLPPAPKAIAETRRRMEDADLQFFLRGEMDEIAPIYVPPIGQVLGQFPRF